MIVVCYQILKQETIPSIRAPCGVLLKASQRFYCKLQTAADTEKKIEDGEIEVCLTRQRRGEEGEVVDRKRKLKQS